MTNDQERHLQEIKDKFNVLVDSKYRKGAAEHGGDLQDMPIIELLDNAIDEAVDQVTYLLTLHKILENGMAAMLLRERAMEVEMWCTGACYDSRPLVCVHAKRAADLMRQATKLMAEL